MCAGRGVQDLRLPVRIVLEPLLHRPAGVGQRRDAVQGVVGRVQSFFQTGPAHAVVAGGAAGIRIAIPDDQFIDVTLAPYVLTIGRGRRIDPFFQHLVHLAVIEMPSSAQHTAAVFLSDNPSIDAVVLEERDIRVAAVGHLDQPVPGVPEAKQNHNTARRVTSIERAPGLNPESQV